MAALFSDMDEAQKIRHQRDVLNQGIEESLTAIMTIRVACDATLTLRSRRSFKKTTHARRQPEATK